MKQCKIEGCTRKHEARDLCKVHYNKAVRSGNLDKHPKRGRPKLYTEEEQRLRNNKKARDRYIPRDKRSRITDDPRYTLLQNAKARAKSYNLPFNITIKDILYPESCPLLGIPLVKGKEVYSDNSPTLDKIIPELGYVRGNIQTISMRANRIKNNSSFEEFELIYNNWRTLLGRSE